MVTVYFFAGLRDAVGRGEIEWHVTGPLPLADLLTGITAELPALAPWLQRRDLLLAVNQEFRGGDHVVVDGDEVALIPPVSGG
jgi:molybdopterin converting factor small subunit